MSSSQGLTRSSKRHSTNSIESSVTRLLVSTKHLLESLTQWANTEVDDKYVSDAYVKLGNDFRAATRAFTHAGVDISDLGDVPQALRVILESALSEPPSFDNLNRFLPNIKNIIVTLLQNLKAKQQRARSMNHDKSSSPPIVMEKRRQKSSESLDNKHSRNNSDIKAASTPQRHYQEDGPKTSSARSSPPFETEPKPSSSPSPEEKPTESSTEKPTESSTEKPTESSTEKNALAQLQNESVLQRRASKRFSAYQYAKLANINPTNALPSVDSGARNVSLQSVRESIRERANAKPDVAHTDEESYIFMRIGSQTKKVPVKMPVTFASLRLLFVEKFAYSPGSSDFPQIYIVDNQTGVSYELEDQYLGDIKTGTLLNLSDLKPLKEEEDSPDRSVNLETERKAVDETSFKELEQSVSELKLKFDNFSESITNTIKESIKSIELPSFSPPPSATSGEIKPTLPDGTSTNSSSSSSTEAFTTPPAQPEKVGIPPELLREVSAIENELKVIKQLQNVSKEAVVSFVGDVGTKIRHLQETGVDANKSQNRKYMEACHARLSEESDNLLTQVDDLQDVMEALRKDVAQRGVRVGQQQLKATMKDIVNADSSLTKMSDFIQKEKAVWKKIWEAELDRVCEEQQFFNLQDDLTRDLKEDLSKIRETYNLVEQCSVEQSKQSSYRRNKVVANLPIPEPGENLSSIKDAVLNEVAALKPDHESRLDAISKAEKLREKNRQMMNMTEFQEELGNFVDDSKLRKSGGIDELERQRQMKDSENLKSSMSGGL